MEFPMTRSVGQSVGRSAGLAVLISQKFHFHAPIGVLVRYCIDIASQPHLYQVMYFFLVLNIHHIYQFRMR